MAERSLPVRFVGRVCSLCPPAPRLLFPPPRPDDRWERLVPPSPAWPSARFARSGTTFSPDKQFLRARVSLA
jgi:hypothetical protein